MNSAGVRARRLRTSVASSVAGILIFAGQAGNLLFGSPSHLVDAVFVLLAGGGIIALGVALWRHVGAAGRGWVLPLVAAVGAAVAIAVEADPYHDIGLFLFEGAWVSFGVVLLRAERGPDESCPVLANGGGNDHDYKSVLE